jgi:hypothetical protein
LIIVKGRQKFIEKIQGSIKKYVKENWSFPFIAGFMVLLFAAAVFLAAGWASLADTTAICAYFSLVAGVLLQLVYFSKNRKEKEVVSYEPS